MLLTQLQNVAWQKSYVGTWYGFFIQISIWSPQEAGSRHSSSRPWSHFQGAGRVLSAFSISFKIAVHLIQDETHPLTEFCLRKPPGTRSNRSKRNRTNPMHFWIPRCISTCTNPFCSLWPRSWCFQETLVTVKSISDPVFANDKTFRVPKVEPRAEIGTWNGCLSGSLDAFPRVRIHFVRSGQDSG